jgi:tRNA A37 methylthiotransferase MiaB
MRAQQQVAFALADERIGSQFEVVVDGWSGSRAVARHPGQAPEVDNVTYITRCKASPGEFVTVRCIGREDYDLVSVPTKAALPALSA